METDKLSNWLKTGLLQNIDPDKQEVVAEALDIQYELADKSIGIIGVPLALRVFEVIPCTKGDQSNLLVTDFKWRKTKTLDEQAELTLILQEALIPWIANWMAKNNRTAIKFGGFTVIDDKLGIYMN